MKAIYVEAFSGVSGNMFLGSLLNLGVPLAFITEEIAKMELGNYEVVYQPANKCGIEASYFNVKLLNSHHHEHEHKHISHDDHGHNHEHNNAQQHAGNIENRHHEHRNLRDITNIINNSALSTAVKEKSINVFNVLASAEARVHGKPLDEIHFHEVGAIDTIIDIVGSVLALEYLGINNVFVSKIQTGFGFVECAHGTMPVPAPATAEILKQLPHYHGQIDKELVTPTGAALMSVLASPVNDLPEGFYCQQIGYGAGTWDLVIPNVLRVYLGEIEKGKSEDDLLIVECNIDDMVGELYPNAVEKLIAKGALDAWITPIIMKKGRPANKISALIQSDNLEEIVRVLMRETSSIGVRYYPVKRKIAARALIKTELEEGPVSVKIAKYDHEIVNIAPEYEDCKKIAEKSGKPLKRVMSEALSKAEEILND